MMKIFSVLTRFIVRGFSSLLPIRLWARIKIRNEDGYLSESLDHARLSKFFVYEKYLIVVYILRAKITQIRLQIRAWKS